MRKGLIEQLEALNMEIIKMGALCEKAIIGTTKALFDGNADYITKCCAMEEEIDKCEDDIQNMCLGLFLRQQPVASDLRNITAALKMISDLERIGDQCVDISSMIRYTAGNDMEEYQHLKTMSEAATKMVNHAVESFVRRDMGLAKSVINMDDIVDKRFDEVKQNLIGYIAKEPDNGEFWIDVIMIAKYYERIADHAVNVAEWVEYSITGEYK